MDNYWNFSPQTSTSEKGESLYRLAGSLDSLKSKHVSKCRLGEFRKITPENMEEVWSYLKQEPGRTTDFSYAGILMWTDYFNYEYTIYNDTLFIKGVVENDLTKPAFSIPVGKMPLRDSVELLKEYCQDNNITLEFSAVPEYALDELKTLEPVNIEELSDWGDYLYEAEMLSELKGKKMSKKRNHVHQFLSHYPDYVAMPLNARNAALAMDFMNVFDLEGDSSEMARAERDLTRFLISCIANGDNNMEGMLLLTEGKVCAFTIGDVKGDTLFVHVEKATRNAVGSYEMINYLFAKEMTGKYPQIKHINREDDAGDIGLRMAKESYHPLCILKKYNVTF